METDSLDQAVACILKQKQENGVEVVVSYTTKSFMSVQLKYCTTCKALAGIIYALRTRRDHLIGRFVTVRTDHSALTYFL